MLEWLRGKKTYILVIIGVLTVLVNFLTGDLTFLQFITSDAVIQLIELLGLGALRAGVSRVTK